MSKRSSGLVLAASILAAAGPVGAAPSIVYSKHLGGNAVASDAEGNAYIAAYAVVKLDSAGQLVWSVPLEQQANGIAVDSAGNVLVVGTTSAGSERNAFVTKLGPDGGILWSTSLGGSERESGEAVAVDAQGDVYVVGTTYSTDFPQVHPLTLSPDTVPEDAFVSKLRADGSALVYSTRLGGRSSDFGEAIAVDPAGHAYVVGQTNSDDFPLLNDVHTPSVVSDEGFLTKLSPAGDALVYSTFLAGGYSENALAVASDPDGYAYVTGYTASGDFFTFNAIQGVLHADEEGTTDLFIAKADPAGNFVYSTYFGGIWSDVGLGIGAGPDGSAWVTGVTPTLDYPQYDPIPGACGPCGGRSDAVLTRLAPDGSSVVFSTLIGGSGEDSAHAIALGPGGSAVLLGFTSSKDFPALPGLSGGFVLKVAGDPPPDCSAAFASPATIWPPDGRIVPVSILGVTDPGGDPVTLEITGITQDEPGADFSGIGFSDAQVKAERDGKGDGRVYRILFEASDPAGGTCTGEVTVGVPHDPGKGSCEDGRR